LAVTDVNRQRIFNKLRAINAHLLNPAYRLIRECSSQLGGGGMGVVYKARTPSSIASLPEVPS